MHSQFISPAILALIGFLYNAIDRISEPIRIARAGYAIGAAGTILPSSVISHLIETLIKFQKHDGGWSDPEETAWTLGLITSLTGEDDQIIRSGIKWLENIRTTTGGWGRHQRDRARIPTTALVSTLVPSLIRDNNTIWLAKEWHRDFDGSVQLSYKAGFFLLAVPQGYAKELVSQTLLHLSEDQNDDGGFGPWKNHPIGSDPWSTGVVLWGLSRWITMVDKAVIHKALAWLERTQLPSGYWPYHYLDDGTSLALIGAVAAMKALASIE